LVHIYKTLWLTCNQLEWLLQDIKP
jgi:hypothetical protein